MSGDPNKLSTRELLLLLNERQEKSEADSKERHNQLVARLDGMAGRVRSLEHWRTGILGGLAALSLAFWAGWELVKSFKEELINVARRGV